MKSVMKYLCISAVVLILCIFLSSCIDSLINGYQEKFFDFRSKTLKVSLAAGPVKQIEKGIVRKDYVIYIVEPLFGTHYIRIPLKSWTMDEYYKEEIQIQMSEDLREYHRQNGDL